jgi:radical SAM protein with 4Fe4S-binding SPASM domain
MKVSPFVYTVEKDGSALCWHSLCGNLYLLEPKYLNVLKNFNKIDSTSNSFVIEQELQDANYLINEETDEREYLKDKNAKWIEKLAGGGQLRLLNLVTSEACNFGCDHCLHKCSIEANPTHGKKLFMDWETAKAAIDAYAAIMNKWGHGLNVHFGSAEPLLNYQVLAQSIAYIKKIDANAKMAINTNLSLLTQEMAEFFRDNQVSISTSLDGPVAGNDAIRKFKNGTGTYETIVNRFELLKKIDYPLDGFSITINDLNFDYITPDFIDWAHEQGFKGVATDIDLINMVNANRSIEDCANKLMEIHQACQKHSIENFGTWTTAYDHLVNGSEDDMPTFCKAAKGQNISINAEGLLFICGHTTTTIGNLNDLDDVLTEDSPYVNLIASRLPGNDPQCFGCEIEGVCAGQCQITREVSRATGNNRDLILCKFYKLVTRKLLEQKLVKELGNL